MTEYIEKEAAKQEVKRFIGYLDEDMIYRINVALNRLPAADVRENKHGEWIDAEWENIDTGEKRKGNRCSICGCGYFRYDISVNTVSDIPNVCPNCGADMRKGETNG